MKQASLIYYADTDKHHIYIDDELQVIASTFLDALQHYKRVSMRVKGGDADA